MKFSSRDHPFPNPVTRKPGLFFCDLRHRYGPSQGEGVFKEGIFFPIKKVQERSRWLKSSKAPIQEMNYLEATKRFLPGDSK